MFDQVQNVALVYTTSATWSSHVDIFNYGSKIARQLRRHCNLQYTPKWSVTSLITGRVGAWS